MSMLLDAMLRVPPVIPTAAVPGRPPGTHCTDEDSKAQGVKYLDSEGHREWEQLSGDSSPGSLALMSLLFS